MVVCFSVISACAPHLPSTTYPFVNWFAAGWTGQRNFTIPTSRTHYEFTCVPASELPDFEEVMF